MKEQSTVLIIENDSMVGPMLRMALQRRGYLALLAQSSADAADFARRRSNEIDLVVCDVGLRGESGQRVATQVCELSPRAKVLFISAVPLSMLCDRGLLSARTLTSGSARFLQKPFLPRDLINVLDSLLAADRDNPPAIQQRTVKHATAH